MKLQALIFSLFISIFSSTAFSFEIATSLFTHHPFSDGYKNKETGEHEKWNEDNKMLSYWQEFDLSDSSNPIPNGFSIKWGVGGFQNSFGQWGAMGGLMIEQTQKTLSNRFIGKYEIYTGLGGVMTNSYDDMSYIPIIVAEVGIRNDRFFASVGVYGGAAITGQGGLRFNTEKTILSIFK